MNPAWSVVAIACLLILGGVFAALIITAAIDTTDAIRAWRNDRTDARDVERGAL